MCPHCLPQRLLKHFSRREKKTNFVAIGALRVLKEGLNTFHSFYLPAIKSMEVSRDKTAVTADTNSSQLRNMFNLKIVALFLP